MAKQMLVTDREDNISDLEIQDRQILDNLRGVVPHRLEKHWRLYGEKGKIPPGEKDKLSAGKFNPQYAPCIYPVKIDPNEPWDQIVNGEYVNIKRCDHVLPTTYEEEGRKLKLSGKNATAAAEIHCRDHVPWYIETHSRPDGRPPATTLIKVPVWVESVDEDPHMSEREKRVKRMESRMKESEVSDQEIAEAVNEQIETKRRGRAPTKKEE